MLSLSWGFDNQQTKGDFHIFYQLKVLYSRIEGVLVSKMLLPKVEGSAKKNWRKAEYVQRRVRFVNVQVPCLHSIIYVKF